MRIRSRSSCTFSKAKGTDLGHWARSHRGLVSALLALLMIALLGVAAWIWYRFEGHAVVDPFLRRRLPKAYERANALPTLWLDVEPQAYRALSDQRASALHRGIPRDVADHPAQVRSPEGTVPVRIALAGDNPDHWQAHKWSLALRAEGDSTVLGMRSFLLQAPALSGYLNRWLYAMDQRSAGVLAPRHAYANLVVNGEDWGVYALEERPSEGFLAGQGREGGVLVHLAAARHPAQPLSAPFDAPADVQVEGHPASDEQLTAAWQRLGQLQAGEVPASQVLDAGRTGRYLAHADLWGTVRQAAWQDETYYYDPSTGMLEPVALAQHEIDLADAPLSGVGRYDDLAIARAYAEEASRISQPGYVDALADAAAQDYGAYRAALAQTVFPAFLEPPWEALRARQGLLSSALHPARPVHARLSSAPDGGTVELRVANLMRHPVALERLQAGDASVTLQAGWVDDAGRAWTHPEASPSVVLSAAREEVPQYVTLRIPSGALGPLNAPGAPAAELQLSARLVGLDEPVAVDVERRPVLDVSSLPAPPTVDEALARHPYLHESDRPGYLALRPGTWHVDGDLVLPQGIGLWATAPVSLTFDPGAILYATGPLQLDGPEAETIRLLPEGADWGGVVVFRAPAGEPSSLRNVEIGATTGERAPGGVAFVESPARLSDCRLLGSTAERMLYAERAVLELVHTEFANASSDALGGDMVQARIDGCAFHDVLGDGLHLAQSDASLRDTVLLRVYGHGVLASRGSCVSAQGVWARDVGIAIASRDVSSVRVDDIRVAQAWVGGLAAYGEGTVHSAARIEAARAVYEDDSTTALHQGVGEVRIDGHLARAGELDLDALQRRREAAGAAQVVSYALGPAIRLAGYDLPAADLAPGSSLQFTLYWQALSRLNRDYTVFVHVLDGAGQIVAQWDAMPRENTFPTTAWSVGELVADPRSVPLPEDLPPGTYRIALGMYYGPTAERLPVRGPAGEPVLNDVVLLGHPIRVQEVSG